MVSVAYFEECNPRLEGALYQNDDMICLIASLYSVNSKKYVIIYMLIICWLITYSMPAYMSYFERSVLPDKFD